MYNIKTEIFKSIKSLPVSKYLLSHYVKCHTTQPYSQAHTHIKQENMDTNYLTCFQKSGDILQIMINSQTNEAKNEKQNEGNYTVTSHAYTSTVHWVMYTHVYSHQRSLVGLLPCSCILPVQVLLIMRSYLKRLYFCLLVTRRAPPLWVFWPTIWQEIQKSWNACKRR